MVLNKQIKVNGMQNGYYITLKVIIKVYVLVVLVIMVIL